VGCCLSGIKAAGVLFESANTYFYRVRAGNEFQTLEITEAMTVICLYRVYDIDSLLTQSLFAATGFLGTTRGMKPKPKTAYRSQRCPH